jgi:putative ABC transport system ATP-binding protein
MLQTNPHKLYESVIGSTTYLMQIILKAEQVSQSFTDTTATVVVLKQVSVSVCAGQSIALVGASGSGKSTLLALLAGLDTPQSGSVTLFGHNLSHLNEEARAMLRSGQTNTANGVQQALPQGVGFVFQNFQLISHLTALENVMLALEISFPQHTYVQQRDIALKWLESVGLTVQANQRAAVLSGGEQQRVALARAFSTQPKIVFADEPTGSLDYATGQRIETLLFEQVKQHNTALVLVTHDAVLAKRCDVVYRIEQGVLSVV